MDKVMHEVMVYKDRGKAYELLEESIANDPAIHRMKGQISDYFGITGFVVVKKPMQRKGRKVYCTTIKTEVDVYELISDPIYRCEKYFTQYEVRG